MCSIAGVRGRSWAVAILGKGLRRPGLGWSVWEGFVEEVTVGRSGRGDSICEGLKVREGFWVCVGRSRAGRSQRPPPRSGGSWAPCVREPTGPVPKTLQESRDPAFQALLWAWLGRAVLPRAVPHPPPGPGGQRDPAGRSVLPETGCSRGGPGQGWGLRETAVATSGVSAGLSVACV